MFSRYQIKMYLYISYMNKSVKNKQVEKIQEQSKKGHESKANLVSIFNYLEALIDGPFVIKTRVEVLIQ